MQAGALHTWRHACALSALGVSVSNKPAQLVSKAGDCRSARGLLYAGTNSGYPTLTLGGSGLCHSLDGFSDEALGTI